MKLHHILRTSVSGLTAHKSRSLLTILGIVIGVAAIIIVMSLGKSAQNLILGQLRAIGSKVIVIVPGREPSGPTDILATFTDSLKERDLKSLEDKSNVPHALTIMPVVFGSQTAAYENETYTPTILGVTEKFADIYKIYPQTGRIFSEEEVKSYADVAVIGEKVKDELFGASDAVGQKIRIKNRNFRVIGVLEKAGQVSFLNFDKVVFVPYTTAQRYIFGIKYFHRLVVEASSENDVEATVADIQATLRANHNITNPDKDDFFIETQASAMQTVGTITTALTLFLTAVAAISLVVGGIGIMNIMLVSVTERTQEIGLRKALGATPRNILYQFLLEAVLLTGVGGVIGIVLGALLSFAATVALKNVYALNWNFTLPLSAVILGLGVSSAIGLIFGIYPAMQAAKKEPMEALRYE
jgi:putative ABC transport system permease protein